MSNISDFLYDAAELDSLDLDSIDLSDFGEVEEGLSVSFLKGRVSLDSAREWLRENGFVVRKDFDSRWLVETPGFDVFWDLTGRDLVSFAKGTFESSVPFVEMVDRSRRQKNIEFYRSRGWSNLPVE